MPDAIVSRPKSYREKRKEDVAKIRGSMQDAMSRKNLPKRHAAKREEEGLTQSALNVSSNQVSKTYYPDKPKSSSSFLRKTKNTIKKSVDVGKKVVRAIEKSSRGFEQWGNDFAPGVNALVLANPELAPAAVAFDAALGLSKYVNSTVNHFNKHGAIEEDKDPNEKLATDVPRITADFDVPMRDRIDAVYHPPPLLITNGPDT